MRGTGANCNRIATDQGELVEDCDAVRNWLDSGSDTTTVQGSFASNGM